jgi:hypothetical protein
VKRLILLALVLATVFCNGGFAEEVKELHTHTYKIWWVRPDLYKVPDGTMQEETAVCLYTFETDDNKQPLIFEGTVENPKTGFSYLSIEEINQFPDEEVLISFFYDGDKPDGSEYTWTTLKKVLLGIESLSDYDKSRDGTDAKKIRI